MEPLLGPFTIIERAPGRYSVGGEIDLSTAHRLDELDDVHGPLVLDLHAVTFIDASGISGLVHLYKRCPHPGCTLRIEACSAQVERLLRIVNLYQLLVDEEAPRQDGDGRRVDLRSSAPMVEPVMSTIARG
jgi:anti-anti-sigma factor